MSAPTPETKQPDQAEPSDGSALWALLVGGAVLIVAALLIFWPGGDATGGGAGGRQGGGAGSQASNSVGGGPGGVSGGGMGVRAREIDPATGRPNSRVTPGLLPEGQAGISMAPPRPPKPEPTSFPSASAEIEYFEKKLAAARTELDSRAMFVERMKKKREDANTPQAQDDAERKMKLVEQNYNSAKQRVEELEQKVAMLKKKQQESGL